MITALVQPLQTKIVNRAIQVFGAIGQSPDTPLSHLWRWGRALQILDGPGEVHLPAIAHHEIKLAQEDRGNSIIPKGYRQSRFTPPVVKKNGNPGRCFTVAGISPTLDPNISII